VRPATRPEFWAEKRAATTARDVRNIAELEMSGWSVLTIWECELRDFDQAIVKVTTFLDS
jgi:DNA mismatch endonuclease (patch repair protein)